jgi:hypothetical protein
MIDNHIHILYAPMVPWLSAGVVSAACQKGDLGNCGISGRGEGRTFNIIYRVMACPEVGEGHITMDAE